MADFCRSDQQSTSRIGTKGISGVSGIAAISATKQIIFP
jgi:hypothetical protein